MHKNTINIPLWRGANFTPRPWQKISLLRPAYVFHALHTCNKLKVSQFLLRYFNSKELVKFDFKIDYLNSKVLRFD